MQNRERSLIFFTLPLVSLTLLCDWQNGLAQIAPDSTLGAESSVVTPNVNINGIPSDRIDGGAVRRGNLFHSLREFNVTEGRGAYFSNPAGIANIFTRVTGTNRSNILGTLGVLGNANLFLINPNGLVFGPNARLDLRGSFLASTADSLIFENGFEFSSTNPSAPPLLTVNIPTGLHFRENPGAIQVSAPGHDLAIQDSIFTPIEKTNNNTGLQVQSGKTLALVGGEIAVEGGILTAPGGQIELGSVSEGNVSLSARGEGWTLGYEGVQNFQDIQISGQSLVDASGKGGGSIQVVSQNLELRDGSVILNQNQGEAPSGNINIKASESIALSGNTPDGAIASSIFNQTVAEGLGGDISIATKRLSLQDGARIGAQSFSSSAGGNLTVSASEFGEVSGFLPANPSRPSAIANYALGSGKAGNLTLSVGRLNLLNGGTVGAFTVGEGAAGEVTVNATDLIEIVGTEPKSFFPSIISASTFNEGDAGKVTVNTRRLALLEGGTISSSTLATGNAGSVTINATESIEASGAMPGARNSTLLGASAIITSEALRESLRLPSVPSGNAGSVTINAPVLKVGDRALVSVRNDGIGNGGTLQVNADSIFLQNYGGITAIASSGSGGNIEINARTVQLENGIINASSSGASSAGNITIRAKESVQVVGSGLENIQENIIARAQSRTLSVADFQSGIVTSSSGEGSAGDIQIETARLTLLNGGTIAAPSFGAGASGRLFLRASESIESNASFVATASFNSGKGGDLEIDTKRVAARDGGQFLATTFGEGDAGKVTVRASEAVDLIGRSVNDKSISGFFADVQSGATGNGGTLTVETGRLTVLDGARISATTYGIGNAGNLTIRASESMKFIGESANSARDRNPLSDAYVTYILAESRGSGNAGNVTLETPRLQMKDGAQVSTATYGAGNAANLTVRASESLDITGADSNGAPSSIYTDSLGTTGNGGNLIIETARMSIRDGAQISVGTFSSGKGGILNISASDSIEIVGSVPHIPGRSFYRDESRTRFPSGLFASSVASGEAGALMIQTGRLMLKDGGQVSVNSQDTGPAGNLSIIARSIVLDASTLTAETTEGNTANIILNAPDIQLRRGSKITTNATRTATGGNITIDAKTIAALENSDISANSSQSFGGRLIINAAGIFGTKFRDALTPKSDITATSELGASFNGTVELNTPDIDPSSGLVTLPQSVVDITGLVGQDACSRRGESEFTVTGKGGLPPNPTEPLSPSATVVDWATLEGRMQEAATPREELPISNTQSPIPNPIVPARGWVFNQKGEVVLTAYDSTGTAFQRQRANPPACLPPSPSPEFKDEPTPN